MKLPKGYKLKKGIEFDKQLDRYRWLPKKNDLFYFEETKTIFKYLEWRNYIKGAFWVKMDGYAKVKNLTTNKSFWVVNLEVRKCIPLGVV